MAELKAKLSEFLVRVRAGDEVLVTDRGRPVAKLVPARDADEHLIELERRGLVRIGSGEISDELLASPRPEIGASVLDALIEERREGR